MSSLKHDTELSQALGTWTRVLLDREKGERKEEGEDEEKDEEKKKDNEDRTGRDEKGEEETTQRRRGRGRKEE